MSTLETTVVPAEIPISAHKAASILGRNSIKAEKAETSRVATLNRPISFEVSGGAVSYGARGFISSLLSVLPLALGQTITRRFARSFWTGASAAAAQSMTSRP